jgi:luciferase family oxidoreductase group 1
MVTGSFRRPLNVLDLGWREFGQDNSAAVRASVDLVRAAERLGFRRHWFAAHHGLPVSTASQPPILMAAAAAATTTIRVGAGPLLLPNYAPLAVAEQFGTLKALFGDRIDLGIGRSSGGFPAFAVRGGPGGRPGFAQEVGELLGHFGSDPGGTPVPIAVPGLGDRPEVWMLGSSSGVSARIAGALSLPFAYAHHFAPDHTERVLDLYRSAFVPAPHLAAPRTMVTVMLVAADTPEDLRRETLTSDITHLRLLHGQRADPVRLDEARGHRFTLQQRAHLARHHHRQAIGTPDLVETTLRALVASSGADEIMVQLAASTAEGRHRSLEVAGKALA